MPNIVFVTIAISAKWIGFADDLPLVIDWFVAHREDVLRVEGDDENALEAIKAQFRELLKNVDSSVELPF